MGTRDFLRWEKIQPRWARWYWQKRKRCFFSRKHGGGSVMVWGGISAFGKTELMLLKGRQDFQKYIQILKDHLIPFVETKEHEFQQDNAPIHVSEATRSFLQESNTQVMDWPACSPGLNPIENVWGLLSRSVYGSGRQYDSEKDLKEAIWSAWRHLMKTSSKHWFPPWKIGAWMLFPRKER